jgi:predicted esterase YcpF (UPF0227 family)
MIVYLHGFRSSPDSWKAKLIAARLQEHGRGDEYLCPRLPASPAEAMDLVLGGLAGAEPAQLCLIGSSLGGCYATWLAERIGCRAVLLNPAVKPARDLASQVGVTTAYHSSERFEFKPEYVAQLAALEVAAITRPERYFLIAATGDEVLDWREMVEHYPGAQQKIIEGSDHGLSGFEQYLDEVLAFAGVSALTGGARN